jgi:hypothetical protein
MHWIMYYLNWKRETTDMREHEMQSLALKKHHLGKTGRTRSHFILRQGYV